ncbi:MAG: hypothetical protein QM662_09835 [Gordonia sp. (in: high G+C Gram-positive bacteria)]
MVRIGDLSARCDLGRIESLLGGRDSAVAAIHGDLGLFLSWHGDHARVAPEIDATITAVWIERSVFTSADGGFHQVPGTQEYERVTEVERHVSGALNTDGLAISNIVLELSVTRCTDPTPAAVAEHRARRDRVSRNR